MLIPTLRLTLALRRKGFRVRQTKILLISDLSNWVVTRNGMLVGEYTKEGPFEVPKVYPYKPSPPPAFTTIYNPKAHARYVNEFNEIAKKYTK